MIFPHLIPSSFFDLNIIENQVEIEKIIPASSNINGPRSFKNLNVYAHSSAKACNKINKTKKASPIVIELEIVFNFSHLKFIFNNRNNNK